ncbi:MAG: cation:proton antiporter [Candidatus Kaistia colombiensis]|nr:MAG: cation:proton antiporter [Kaistia sp.]
MGRVGREKVELPSSFGTRRASRANAPEARIRGPVETITIALVLLLAVVVSEFLTRMLRLQVPRPLVQIALGGVIGLSRLPRSRSIPSCSFLLFLPPLLFLDGWRIPKEELFRDAAIRGDWRWGSS